MLLVDEPAIAVAARHFGLPVRGVRRQFCRQASAFTLPPAPKLERLASVLDVSMYTSLGRK
jgi:hypothetical protein